MSNLILVSLTAISVALFAGALGSALHASGVIIFLLSVSSGWAYFLGMTALAGIIHDR